jgi:hypothetical protein
MSDASDRPRPPDELLDEWAPIGFVPALELQQWVTSTFLDETSPLFNEDHQHFLGASLGFLWTNAANARHGRRIIGQAEFKPPGGTMGKWQRARAQAQLRGWFGTNDLDFLITIDAQYAAECSDEAFCALVEHELYHCGQEQDEFGVPKFKGDSGMPVFCMRGHDIEEFVGVVRRYGAVTADVQALVEAASRSPSIDIEAIGKACGSCG